ISVFAGLPAGSSWTIRTSLASDLSAWMPQFTLGAMRQISDRFAADLELSMQRLRENRRWIHLALGGRFIARDSLSPAAPKIVLSSFPVSLVAANLGGGIDGWSFQTAFGANLTMDCSWLVGEHVRVGEAITTALVAPLPEGIDAALPMGDTAGGILTLTSHAGFVP
ncbi:hypothetical protein JW848_08590, partial [Candidatus Bipolaricaulota bacterium]|nr:hypothetical protein [Candidatus Bipolaricaulota bacterium]